MSKKKAKNYEYQSKKKVEDTPRISKKTGFIAMGVLGAVLLLVIVLVCIEKSMENKIIVKNKSSHDITNIQIWYEDENEDITDVLDLGAVASKEKVKDSTENLELSQFVGDAWLSVQIEFEDGGKALIQTGQFLYGFKGKISLEIDDTKYEEVMLHLKAGEGLFNSTAVTGCDDVYYINPKDGYIE